MGNHTPNTSFSENGTAARTAFARAKLLEPNGTSQGPIIDHRLFGACIRYAATITTAIKGFPYSSSPDEITNNVSIRINSSWAYFDLGPLFDFSTTTADDEKVEKRDHLLKLAVAMYLIAVDKKVRPFVDNVDHEAIPIIGDHGDLCQIFKEIYTISHPEVNNLLQQVGILW